MKTVIRLLPLVALVLGVISCRLSSDSQTLTGYILKVSDTNALYGSNYILSGIRTLNGLTGDDVLAQSAANRSSIPVVISAKDDLEQYVGKEVYLRATMVDYPKKISPICYEIEIISLVKYEAK